MIVTAQVLSTSPDACSYGEGPLCWLKGRLAAQSASYAIACGEEYHDVPGAPLQHRGDGADDRVCNVRCRAIIACVRSGGPQTIPMPGAVEARVQADVLVFGLPEVLSA